MNETSKSRYFLLDLLRGIAALAVVFWHWKTFWYDHGKLTAYYNSTQLPMARAFSPLYNAGWYAVDLFFVLSGFVFFWLYSEKIQSRESSVGAFFKLRFSRLYPLHLLTLVVVAISQFLYCRRFGQFFMFQENDSYHFALNLGLVNAWGFETDYSFNGPSWSISIEVLLYAAFFLLCWARLSNPVVVLAIIGVTLASGWSSTHLGRGITGFFSGGMVHYASEVIRRRNAPTGPMLGAAILGVVGSVVLARLEATPVPHAFIYRLAVFPLAVLALVLLEHRLPSVGRRWGWLGDISYSSYLWHFPLQIAFATAFFSLGFTSEVFYSPVVFVGFFAVLIPLSLASFHWFERPMQRLLRRTL